MENILSIKNLSVSLSGKRGIVPILQNISLEVEQGHILGIVGESGSGKSMTAFAINQLLPGGRKSIVGGSISFCGEDLTEKTEKEMTKFRGKEIAMIFQEPMTCLNPVFTIGRQMKDVIMTHQKKSSKEAEKQAEDMLEKVHIRNPNRVLSCYPYELSGGMRQRVMIAIALSCSPKLLIADEPTTALDVTIQAQIIFLIKEACKAAGTGVIFISHDLGVVSQLCDTIAVMYSGQIVEIGRAADVLAHPQHPYTKALLASIPSFTPREEGDDALSAIPGMVPDPLEVITGCRFAPRCSYAMDICHKEVPPLQVFADGYSLHCHLQKEVEN